MSEIVVTKDNFESEVLKAKLPVLVDFWAPWCGPCRMLSPVIAKIAEKYEGKLVVGKVNVDDDGELASQFGVVSIPTLIIFKDGQVVSQRVGGAPQSLIESFISPVLN